MVTVLLYRIMLMLKRDKERALEVLGFNAGLIDMNLLLNGCRKGNCRVTLEMIN